MHNIQTLNRPSLPPRSSPNTDNLLWARQSGKEKSLAYDAITILKVLTDPKNQISDHARGIYRQYFLTKHPTKLNCI